MGNAFIFPGQGSQEVGMGYNLHQNFKVVQRLFEEASDNISLDMKKLCFEGPQSELNLTFNTQPAIFLVSISAVRVLNQELGLQADYFSGHSIGEYAACVSAGALSFADAIKAVRKRGQYMQEAVPEGQGAMIAALGFTETQARKLCDWVIEQSGEDVFEPANYNAPGQVVLSGSRKAADYLVANYDKTLFPDVRRHKFIPLQVSAPFHCSLMTPAQEKMKMVLESINFTEAEQPVIQNFDAVAHRPASEIRQNLIQQISACVQWTACIENLVQLGATRFFECGHGQVLKGLVKKIDKNISPVQSVGCLEDIKSIEQSVNCVNAGSEATESV